MQNPGRQIPRARERKDRSESSKQLWRMSAKQRVSAMRRGELTQSQLLEWVKQRPNEVPLINGEFEFIAALTPEVAEIDSQQQGR
jgi:hypothetical protein